MVIYAHYTNKTGRIKSNYHMLWFPQNLRHVFKLLKLCTNCVHLKYDEIADDMFVHFLSSSIIRGNKNFVTLIHWIYIELSGKFLKYDY